MEQMKCPHCGEDYNGIECDVCGFADDATDTTDTIPCPECGEPMPAWSELCIKCWHKRNMESRDTFTNQENVV